MSTSYKWVISILGLITLSLLGWNLTENEEISHAHSEASTAEYQSQHTETTVYDPTGKLQYQLIADNVKYYKNQENGWFNHPIMTLFDKNSIAIWRIRSNSATLTKDNLLYLHGDVKVDSLVDTSQLQHIDTSNALVNLVTQDVSSDEEVTLVGHGFRSHGFKMRGNLREKQAQLIEKVKSTYEIKTQ